jgi:hypothetical protein
MESEGAHICLVFVHSCTCNFVISKYFHYMYPLRYFAYTCHFHILFYIINMFPLAFCTNSDSTISRRFRFRNIVLLIYAEAASLG